MENGRWECSCSPPIYDVEDSKLAEAIGRHGAAAAAAGRIHAVEADVYAPCALGAVLSSRTVPELKAKVVAGAANNQLGEPAQDMQLFRSGVTYCPDYVVNAGGVLSVAASGTAYERDAALERVAQIRQTTRSVLELARTENIPTGMAADQMAMRRLSEGAKANRG